MSSHLDHLRDRIDIYDKAIQYLVLRRLALIPLVAKVKKHEKIPILQEDREQKIYNQLDQFASEMGIGSKVLKEIFQSIIQESKSMEHQFMMTEDVWLRKLQEDPPNEMGFQNLIEGFTQISDFNKKMDSLIHLISQNKEKQTPFQFLVMFMKKELQEGAKEDDKRGDLYEVDGF